MFGSCFVHLWLCFVHVWSMLCLCLVMFGYVWLAFGSELHRVPRYGVYGESQYAEVAKMNHRILHNLRGTLSFRELNW